MNLAELQTTLSRWAKNGRVIRRVYRHGDRATGAQPPDGPVALAVEMDPNDPLEIDEEQRDRQIAQWSAKLADLLGMEVRVDLHARAEMTPSVHAALLAASITRYERGVHLLAGYRKN